MKRFFSFWGPVFVWAGVIFLFSSQPTIKVTEFYWWDFVLKKTAHLIEYFVLYTLLYRAIKNLNRVSAKRIFLFSLIIMFAYAISDELHQSFISGREATLRDVLIDSLGGLIALWAIKYKLPKAPEKLLNWAKSWQIL